jgi:hypothetical protein
LTLAELNTKNKDPQKEAECKELLDNYDITTRESTANVEQFAKAITDTDRLRLYQDIEDEQNEGFAVTLGGRFLYRSDDISGNAPGAAAELTPEYVFPWGAGFLSGSLLWVTDSLTTEEDLVSVSASLTELKATAGWYFKFNVPSGSTQLAPRVGFHVTYSKNFWNNRFAEEGTDDEIRGHQWEGGIFAAGQFIGGFNGLVQFSVRDPYGPDSKPELFVTIVPSLGTTLAGDQ